MRKILLTLLTTLLCSITAWGATLISGTSFENNNVNSWNQSNISSLSVTDTEHRTGSYALKATNKQTSGSGSLKLSHSYTKDTYIHVIVWLKFSVTANTTISFNGTNGTSDATSVGDSWTRLYHTYNFTGSTGNKNTQINFPRSTNPSYHYLDDAIIYYDNSSTTDLTKPTSATSASATTSSISWTNGSDASTGIDSTLIFRRTSGSSDDLTLNDQGIYSIFSGRGATTDQSGHWTIVKSNIANDATSFSGTFSEGDRYAIVHRDIAYNYSTPTYVTVESGSCTATANAGADKNTTVNTGVALAATAAGDGKTGAWTVQSAPDGATGDYAPTFSSTSSATATFTPKVKGSYTLRWTVTCTEGESSANDDMEVSVCAPISPTLDYTSTSLTVGAGNSSAPSLDKNGSSGTVTWESSAPAKATVNGSGVVTPVAAGSATITATIAADAENHYCANTATADFTISAAPVSTPVISSVTVDNSTVCVGDDITLTCTASNSPTSYTWYRNTSASTAGATSLGDATATNTKTTSTSALAAGTYYFYCVATNASGSSDPVFTSAVKVATKPGLTISLAP